MPSVFASTPSPHKRGRPLWTAPNSVANVANFGKKFWIIWFAFEELVVKMASVAYQVIQLKATV